jgi:hypothetical protein
MFSRKSSGVGASVAINKSYSPQTNLSYLTGAVNGTPTSTGTWTLSLWIKRTKLGVAQVITANTTGPFEGLYIDATDTLYFYLNGAVAFTGPVLRDTASWYNITVTVNGFGTAILFVNGTQVCSNGPLDPLLYSYYYNAAGYTKVFGNYTGGANQFYGSIAGVYFLDGYVTDANYFGKTNVNTGTFQPGGSGTVGISGSSYGNNGFNLLFLSNSIGANLASSANQFTETGSHITPSYDVPPATQTSANYSILNFLQTSGTLSAGGTTVENGFALSTMAMTSGQWYWECTFNGTATLGITDGTTGSNISPTGTNLTYGFKLDLTAGTFQYTTNGTTYTSIATGLTSPQYFVRVESFTGSGAYVKYNSGITNFVYPAPSGFAKLNSYNLPTNIIFGGYNNTALNYAGNGSSKNLTYTTPYTGFKPDLLWIKKTSTGNADWAVVGSYAPTYTLFLNTRSYGTANPGYVSSLNTNGFSVGNAINVNQSGSNYASYAWKTNGGVYNTPTQGTIASTASTSTDNGLSIVQYTSTNVAGTIGHGLGSIPQFIIVKQWTFGTGGFSRGWAVYHKDVGNTIALFMDSTSGGTSSSGYWNNTSPTSTVFSVGTDGDVNSAAGNPYLAYCWAPVAGYSSFGKWTGSGNATTGSFVYTGFQPAFIMYKGSNTNNWVIADNTSLLLNTGTVVASASNPVSRTLNPNLDTGYQTGVKLDILSNGFKIRTADADTNATGVTYVYAAFAKSPLSVSDAV